MGFLDSDHVRLAKTSRQIPETGQVDFEQLGSLFGHESTQVKNYRNILFHTHLCNLAGTMGVDLDFYALARPHYKNLIFLLEAKVFTLDIYDRKGVIVLKQFFEDHARCIGFPRSSNAEDGNALADQIF